MNIDIKFFAIEGTIYWFNRISSKYYMFTVSNIYVRNLDVLNIFCNDKLQKCLKILFIYNKYLLQIVKNLFV